MKLKTGDYKTILTFYKIDARGLSAKALKAKAEHLLAVKLCRCIKNIKGKSKGKGKSQGQGNEKRAIAVCYNSVLTKKKLKVFKFNCKKTVKLLPKKGKPTILVEKLAG
jgi:hypothetical protein